MLQFEEDEFKRLHIEKSLTAQEFLIKLFSESGMSDLKIAEHFGCSAQAIRKQFIRATVKEKGSYET